MQVSKKRKRLEVVKGREENKEHNKKDKKGKKKPILERETKAVQKRGMTKNKKVYKI